MPDGSADGDRSTVSRRRLLATAGSGAIPGVAGCVSDGSATTATDSSATDAPGAERASETDAEQETTETPETETETVDVDVPPGGDWEVVFEDRFDQGELDTDRWEYGFGPPAPDCPEDDEWFCAVEDNVRVDRKTDRLVITTTDESTNGRPYSSGAIATGDAFEQEFGYFEAKSRVPAQPGGVHAFWMMANFDEHSYREIDVYEVDGRTGRHPKFGVYYACSGEWDIEDAGVEDPDGVSLSDEFTVWGCAWTPDSVAFYVDGEERHRESRSEIADCLPGAPLYVILNSAVTGDGWAGDATEADYPYTHEVEWVRVWRHDDHDEWTGED